MKFPTMDEFAKSVAEKALDEFEYKGKTLRQWIEIISAFEHGTDCISKQQAIDGLRGYLVGKRCPDDGTLTCRLIENEVINKLPPVQPDNNLQKLADEIASFKRHVKSDNSDYLTGYLCALSVVEGMIADMRGE